MDEMHQAAFVLRGIYGTPRTDEAIQGALAGLADEFHAQLGTEADLGAVDEALLESLAREIAEVPQLDRVGAAGDGDSSTLVDEAHGEDRAFGLEVEARPNGPSLVAGWAHG